MLEQLGGPAERRRVGTAGEWAGRARDIDDLNVIAVRYLPDERHFAPLPDDAFAHDGQITKQSMRAVTMAALAPRPGELSMGRRRGLGQHCHRVVPQWRGCNAVAFEQDEQRRRIIDNAAAFGVRIEVRPQPRKHFDCVRTPSAIFVGGGLTHAGLLDALLDRSARGRTAGGQRRHPRIRSPSRAVVFAASAGS